MQTKLISGILCFLALLGPSFLLAQETQTNNSTDLYSLCERIKVIDLSQSADVKNEVLKFVDTYQKSKLEIILNDELLKYLMTEEMDSCPLEQFNLIVGSTFPVASQTAVLSRSVQSVVKILKESNTSIKNLSELSESFNYLLTLEGLPSEVLRTKIEKFLSEKIQDKNLDLRVRFYAFLVLSGLSSSNCPRFSTAENITISSNTDDVEFPSVKNSNRCKVASFQDALSIIRKIIDSGDLNQLNASLGFFYNLYASREDKVQINLVLVKESLGNQQIRSIAFPLINRELISLLNIQEKTKLLALGQMPFLVYLVLFASFILPIGSYYLVLLIFSLRTDSKEVPKNKSVAKKGLSDEYSILLESFGLDDQATESDIKKAYRELARKFHPDSADHQTREEFEKVQSNYDKLMKLRKGWFGLSR